MANTAERSRLSRETVTEGALALADAEGLDGLTIRGLAQRLGVTPMALYWHFKNKDELLLGVVDLIWSKVDIRVDPDRRWIDQLRTIIESMVRVLRAHPAAAPLVTGASPENVRSCFSLMETALDILRGAGFTPFQAAEICSHGMRTAVSLAVVDTTAGCGDADMVAARRHKRVALETLAPDQYPHVIEAAGPLSGFEDPEAYVSFGIDLFLAGVEALAPSNPSENRAIER